MNLNSYIILTLFCILFFQITVDIINYFINRKRLIMIKHIEKNLKNFKNTTKPSWKNYESVLEFQNICITLYLEEQYMSIHIDGKCKFFWNKIDNPNDTAYKDLFTRDEIFIKIYYKKITKNFFNNCFSEFEKRGLDIPPKKEKKGFIENWVNKFCCC